MKKFAVVPIFMIASAILISSCTGDNSVNLASIQQYLPTMYTDSNALESNNYGVFDGENSFTVGFDSKKATYGDTTGAEKINWGLASKFRKSECEYENFWGASTEKLSNSPEILGMASKLSSIVMDVENYDRSNFGIVIENVLAFKSSETKQKFFNNIGASLNLCSKNVEIFDLQGRETTAPFTNSNKTLISFFKPNQASVMRVGRDGLVHLQLFVSTKFSVVNFEFMLNDSRMSAQRNWSVLNSMVNASLEEICKLEKCQLTPIFFESSKPYVPTDQIPAKIEL